MNYLFVCAFILSSEDTHLNYYTFTLRDHRVCAVACIMMCTLISIEEMTRNGQLAKSLDISEVTIIIAHLLHLIRQEMISFFQCTYDESMFAQLTINPYIDIDCTLEEHLPITKPCYYQLYFLSIFCILMMKGVSDHF